MADIRVLKYGTGGHKVEHDAALDSIQFASFKTTNYELTDSNLGTLISAGDATALHHHDSRYFREDEHIDASTGASDAGKPLITNASGVVDSSFLDLSGINSSLDHGALAGLGDDDHVQYILVDGTRAFTGAQSMGGFNLTNVADPSAALDAANKQYVDAVATGLRPKGDVEAASAGTNFSLSGLATLTVDGISINDGERVLLKDQTDATENGIYVYDATAQTLSRSADQDNAPLAEVVNGVFVPRVQQGTVNGGKAFLITSQGSGTDGLHTLGTDDIIWSEFSSATQLVAGDGIVFTSNVVSARLLASGGLKFVSGEIAVEPADFVGDGLIDDGSDNIAIDWASDFTIDAADAKAIKASDLASTSTGFGASIIGVEDANSYFVGTSQEEVNNELYAMANANSLTEYTAGVGGIVIGQLVYIDSNDTVLPLTDITVDSYCVGLAMGTASAGSQVQVVRFDELLTGVLSTAVAGTIYYWDGSGLVTTRPSASQSNVWMVGVAANATDLSVEVRHLFKVS
jgi:hypothetical protein